MKPLEKDELYHNLNGFLKAKGIELKDGSYSRGIQNACELLAEAINLGQKGLKRAKVEVDQKLDQMRQTVHEKTAPKAGTKTSAGKPRGPGRAQSATSKASPPATGAAKQTVRSSSKPSGKK